MDKYAALHKFDAVVLDNRSSDRPLPWHKILVIEKLFSEGYEFVFWIDADAVFVRFDLNIADEIEDGKELYLVKHIIDGKETPNTGVFLIHNSDFSKDILSRIWNMHEYINHRWWENAALIDLLGFRELLKEGEVNNINTELLKKIKWLDVCWNSLPGLCESKHQIINHYAGRTFDFRLENMKLNMKT